MAGMSPDSSASGDEVDRRDAPLFGMAPAAECLDPTRAPVSVAKTG